MSEEVIEIPFDISPFGQPQNADVILQSSDDEKFYVRKMLLILTSEVFANMFTLPQGTHEDGEDLELPVVRIGESKVVLLHLLLWCDPRCTPSWKMENIELALGAADKYNMPGVMARISQVLTSNNDLVAADPVSLYAIGIKYGFPEGRKGDTKLEVGGSS